jgi:hypothetical protein
VRGFRVKEGERRTRAALHLLLIKITPMVLDMIEEIQRYTESVRNGTLTCDLDRCPRCGKRPSGFTRHDQRRRAFLVVVASIVHKVLSALTRWKCPLCGKPFTFYPVFALPHKRYVRDTVLEKVTRYVEDDAAAYRSAVKEQGRSVGYARTPEGAFDERQLSPSTVHRWLSSFSGLRSTLHEALRLIKEKSPGSGIFRSFVPIVPWKYRSERRRLQLLACRRLLQADREYRGLFGRSVFPHLATVCAWK